MAKASTESSGKARATGSFVAPAAAKAKTAVVERRSSAAAAKTKSASVKTKAAAKKK